MKSPTQKLALIALLTLTLIPAYATKTYAAMEDEEVKEDTVVPESGSNLVDQAEPEVKEEVIVKKLPAKRKTAPKRRVIIQEVEDSQDEEASSDQAQPQAVPASTATVGSSVDQTINKKLDGARQQIESKIAEAIDGMQITIGGNQAAAPQQALGPTTTTVVQDQTVQKSAAPMPNEKAYMTVDEAPKVDGESADATDESKAALDTNAPLKGRMSVFPLFGLSTINPGTNGGGYSPESDYTAGLGVEVDVADNMSFVGNYQYSKYNIKLTSQGMFPIYGNYGSVYPGYGYNSNDLNSLKYSQNAIDAGMRLYLLPKQYRYRFFVGAGMGYQRGYLNYQDTVLNMLSANPSLRMSGYLDDYVITQFLFNAEAGGEINLTKAISLGGLFRYSTVVSSSTQDQVNSGWYNQSGFTQYGQATDKTIVGNSLAKSGFYSILGTLKYSF